MIQYCGGTLKLKGNKARSHARRKSIAVAALLLATACSSEGDSVADQGVVNPTVAVEPTITPAPTPPPEPTSTAAPVLEQIGDEDVLAAWNGFVDGVIGPEDDQTHLVQITQFGSEAALATMRQRFIGPLDRVIDQSSATVTATNTGWNVDACFITDPPAGEIGWLWYKAVAIETEDSAVLIDQVTLVQNGKTCVPTEINNAVIAGYEAGDDRRGIFASRS